MAELESYFRGRMRSANSAVNETRVLAGLRKTALFASQALLFLGDGMPPAGQVGGSGGQGGRNRRVVIGEERVCGVCHKRIGGSVVAVLPDNTVVHYGCLGRAAAAAAASASAGSAVGSVSSRALSPSGESGSFRSGSVPVSGVGGLGAWGRVGG